jgi:hypothetical protein
MKVIDEIVLAALQARRRAHPYELKRCRVLLAEGAVDAQSVNRSLFATLQTDLERNWQRGWQPAELVRLAKRELTVRHSRLMIDAIAAQLRVYAPVTLDLAWQAQLATMNARVWWANDDQYLDLWAAQQELTRGDAIDDLLDVLYLLRALPVMEQVSAKPGEARPSTATVINFDVDQRMLSRVRALLAKAESTSYPEEAEAFTAKAQQLMARHSIDHALLAAKTGARDAPVTRRIGIDNPYEVPKTLLLQVVADANRCRAAWMKRFGLSTVVGFPADLDSTELLFTSLLVQATKAMTQLNPRPDRYGRNNTRSFRQSFLTAYATRIGERLSSATEEAVASASADVSSAPADGPSLLPVLAARHEAVQKVFEKQFPELTSHKSRVSNREGWASGRAAADRASLHGHQAVAR